LGAKDKLVVLIPTMNESNGIGPTLDEIRNVLGDVPCLVVDRSTDTTGRVAEEHGAKVIVQTGKGKGRAVKQGLARLKGGASLIVLTDGDFTYPAEAIQKFVAIAENDPTIGMVAGNRFGKELGPGVLGSTFYVGNKIISQFHNILSRQRMADPLTGLRLLRADLFRDWKPLATGFDIEVEMNQYVADRGYRIAEIPITYRVRLGKKKLKPRDALWIVIRMTTSWLRGL